MRFTTIVATSVAVLAFHLDGHAHAMAQDPAAPATPPAAPAPAAAPMATPATATAKWTDADRSPEAIKRGEDIIRAAAKAYRAAPALTEDVKFKVEVPGMGGSEDRVQTEFEGKGAMRFTMDAATVIATDGTVYFVPKEPSDKYVEKKVEGTIGATLDSMLPGFQMPTAALALRESAEDADSLAVLMGGMLSDVKVIGSRSADGVESVLLKSDDGEALVSFDSKTHLQTGTVATVSPDGAPAGMSLTLNLTVTNTVAPSLAEPIKFEKGERTAAKDLMELMGMGAGAAPEEPKMKVAIGDTAPTAVLRTLDGKDIDLATLKGKVVVLDFWATWCGPCKKGLPILQEFADSMKSNDRVVVYPVNVWENTNGDDRTKTVGDFWSKQKFTMTTLVDPESKYIDTFGFTGIPAFVIIGTDGTIAALHTGFDAKLKETLTKDVEAALAKK